MVYVKIYYNMATYKHPTEFKMVSGAILHFIDSGPKKTKICR